MFPWPYYPLCAMRFRNRKTVRRHFTNRKDYLESVRRDLLKKFFACADNQFPRVFEQQWLAGNKNNALAEPNSIVLTETLARKNFGSGPWLGETMNFENLSTLKVTGVIQDPPVFRMSRGYRCQSSE